MTSPSSSLTIEQIYQFEKQQRSKKIFELQQKAEKARLLRSKQKHIDEKNININDTEIHIDKILQSNLNINHKEGNDTEIYDEKNIIKSQKSVFILEQSQPWSMCGYEHIIKKLNFKIIRISDLMSKDELISEFQDAIELYIIQKIPYILNKFQNEDFMKDKKIILIPGIDGFATYSMNISQVICKDIFIWANNVFDTDNVEVIKMFSRKQIILNPESFDNHKVLFLHIMDSFTSQTDVVLNAWLDPRIKTDNKIPQLLILADFNHFYQIFQLFNKNLIPIKNGKTAFIQFKNFFKIKNKNIFISFHNYTLDELELICKSVSFFVQPSQCDFAKLVKKFNCGIITQDISNGFSLLPRFIDYDIVIKRLQYELYLTDGDQHYPFKYVRPITLIKRVKQAVKYVSFKRLQ